MLNFCPVLDQTLRSLLSTPPPLPPLLFKFLRRCPPLLRNAMIVVFAEFKFLVNVAIWVVKSAIVFDRRLTASWSDRIAVAKFANADVWSCCNSAKSSALRCASFALAAYRPVCAVSADLRTYLNARTKWSLKVAQSLDPVGPLSQYRQFSV